MIGLEYRTHDIRLYINLLKIENIDIPDPLNPSSLVVQRLSNLTLLSSGHKIRQPSKSQRRCESLALTESCLFDLASGKGW